MDPLEEAKKEELRNKIRTAPRDNGLYFLGLLKKCCNGSCDGVYGPSDELMIKIFGSETAMIINRLQKLASENRRHGINDVMENTTEEKVKEYLEDNLNDCAIYNTLSLLIETWIRNNKKEFSDPQLESEICAVDNDKWIEQWHVTELYSDGTITSQKGRDLYGWRSVFTIEPPLLHNFKMTFPRKSGNEDKSFVVVESEAVAKAFRNRMIALSSN
jgi:hypothetical protein